MQLSDFVDGFRILHREELGKTQQSNAFAVDANIVSFPSLQLEGATYVAIAFDKNDPSARGGEVIEETSPGETAHGLVVYSDCVVFFL